MFQENTFVTTKEAIKFIDEVLFNGEKVDGLKLYKINDRDFFVRDGEAEYVFGDFYLCKITQEGKSDLTYNTGYIQFMVDNIDDAVKADYERAAIAHLKYVYYNAAQDYNFAKDKLKNAKMEVKTENFNKKLEINAKNVENKGTAQIYEELQTASKMMANVTNCMLDIKTGLVFDLEEQIREVDDYILDKTYLSDSDDLNK